MPNLRTKRIAWICAAVALAVASTLAYVERDSLHETWLLHQIGRVDPDADVEAWESLARELVAVGGDRTATLLTEEFLRVTRESDPEVDSWPALTREPTQMTPEEDDYFENLRHVVASAEPAERASQDRDRLLLCRELLGSLGETSYSAVVPAVRTEPLRRRLWAAVLLSSLIREIATKAAEREPDGAERVLLARDGWIDPPPVSTRSDEALGVLDEAIDRAYSSSDRGATMHRFARCMLYARPFAYPVVFESIAREDSRGNAARLVMTYYALLGSSFVEPALSRARRSEIADIRYSAQTICGFVLSRNRGRRAELDSYLEDKTIPTSLEAKVRARVERAGEFARRVEGYFIEDFASDESKHAYVALSVLGSGLEISSRLARGILARIPHWTGSGHVETACRVLEKAPAKLSVEILEKLAEVIESKPRETDEGRAILDLLAGLAIEHPDSFTALIAAAASDDSRVRSRRGAILAEVAGRRPAKLLAALSTSDAPRQIVLLEALSDSTNPETERPYPEFVQRSFRAELSTVLSCTENSDPEVRRKAATLISHARAFNLVAAAQIESWAKSGSPDLRLIAIRGLGLVPDEAGRGRRLLRSLVDDEDESSIVREAAANALESLGNGEVETE